jgi:hypothetical protein
VDQNEGERQQRVDRSRREPDHDLLQKVGHQ